MIDKKLIHFNTYAAFEANKSQIYDHSIVFIADTKQLYTHGNFYDCNIENINDLEDKIIDLLGDKQDIISDLATIRSGASKGATALQSIPSEYVTESELTAKGYATNTSVNSSISSLQSQINTLVSGDASTAVDSFNEIIAFLEGVEDTETLDGIIAGINTSIANKANKSDAIKSISRNGTTFTATRVDGTTFTFTQLDNNTTYTFAGGTNSFTVTPSGGSAQTVSVTPSISNNVTYNGTLTSGQVAVYDGTAGKIKASGYTIASSVPSGAKFTDTTYSAATSTAAGLMSANDKTKLDGITTGANNYSLPLAASGTRGGIQIGYTATGANVPLLLSSEKAYVTLTKSAVTSALGYTPPASDTDTHYTTRLYAGASGTAANAATNNPYVKVTDNNVYRNQIQFKGSGATTVSSDANGVITISSTDNNTTYSSKSAASGGTDVSLVTTGEKYTWNAKASTSVATTSANGLMSSSDKTKLNGIATGATANTGTITGITMNGVSKGTSGVVDLGTVITAHQDISGKQDKNLYFTNLTASSWSVSTTYSDYEYQCDITTSGVTASHFAEVVFSPEQASSGDYAPVCETLSGKVRIYSKTNTSITIPTIVVNL